MVTCEILRRLLFTLKGSDVTLLICAATALFKDDTLSGEWKPDNA